MERAARVPRHYDGEYSASVMYGAIGRSTQDAYAEVEGSAGREEDTSLLDLPNN